METRINQLSGVLIGVIGIGATFRLVFCLFKMGFDEERHEMYRRRAMHAGVFLVLSITIWALKDMVIGYY